MAPAQLTKRTMDLLRESGYAVDVCERHSPRPAREVFDRAVPGRPRMAFFLDRKIDLFGGLDLVAIGETGIVGVQVTSAANHAARRAKLLAIPELRLWVKYAALWIVSWKKVKDPPGSKRLVWRPRIEPLLVHDFESQGGARREAIPPRHEGEAGSPLLP